MALPNETISMALYCDFENVALGVRDAKYNKFDIQPVLERLLLKGSIVVKKAYCDWDRYKEFKPQMHEASFELIEIPHVRMSGKNSADIRLVVDALDLCYTKSHVNTFVIISGDSDFSPLVSKLRENAKYVIGVGVKNSTSDLLIANCDEFIFIDDLVRETRRTAAKREVKQSTPTAPASRPASNENQLHKEDLEVRKSKAIDIATETFDALMTERGDSGKIWASSLKQAIKRRKPDFNETYFGFRTFGNLLEEAQSRGLIDIGRDDKSGTFVYRSMTAKSGADTTVDDVMAKPPRNERNERNERSERNGRRPARGRQAATVSVTDAAQEAVQDAAQEAVQEVETMTSQPEPAVAPQVPAQADPEPAKERRRSGAAGRTGRKTAAQKAQSLPGQETPDVPAATTEMDLPNQDAQPGTAPKASRKPAARSRRPRKPEAVTSDD